MSPGSPVAHEAWDLKLEALRASMPACTIIISGFEWARDQQGPLDRLCLYSTVLCTQKASELQDT